MNKQLLLCVFASLATNTALLATTKLEKLFATGTQLLKQRNFEQAIQVFEKVLHFNQDFCEAHYFVGLCYEYTDQIDTALEHFNRAIAIKPSFQWAYEHTAPIYFKKNNFAKAKEHYLMAMQYNPNNHKAHHHLGKIFFEETAMDQCISHLHEALRINPDDVHVLLDLANAKNVLNETEEALSIYRKLDTLHPNNQTFMYNIAYSLKKLGRLQEAIPYYKRVLDANPEHAEAHFSYGLALLLQGDWEQGWREYHWRWIRHGQSTFPNFNRPLWDGSNLQGKTIYFRAEQGLGDTFQFIRYVKIAKEMGAKTIVAVQEPLITYMRTSPYIDTVVAMNEMPPNFDVYAPLLSCPMIMNTTIDTVPTPIPYLHADTSRVRHWQEQLAQDKKFKIGICWQGNPNYSTHFLRMTVAAKSMQLKTLLPLFSIPNTSFYCLQFKSGLEQLADLPSGIPFTVFDASFDKEHGSFVDSAAVIKNLDLVITVDTSTGHFAAGLGVPTWVMLPEPPDWRWMLDRSDTPWYPNMRLFRQQKSGDWQSVIDAIATELITLLDIRS